MQEIGTAAIVNPSVSAGTQSIERVARLFDRHQSRLYRLARRLSPDVYEATDLVQETFLRVARRPWAIPQGEGAEEGWLIRILINLCRDRHRRLATRERARASMIKGAADTSPAPEAAIVARATVQKALSRLSPRRRAVVILHELEEIPVERVARLLGIAQVTVRWNLSLAKKELTRFLTAGSDQSR